MIRWTKVMNETFGSEHKAERTPAGETHQGLVLKAYWKTYQVMSDIWEDHPTVLVWDGAKPREFPINYLRGGEFGLPDLEWGGHYEGVAEVDATPETLAAYKAYEDAKLAQERALREQASRERAEAEAREPRAGRWVKVVRGRKVPVGIQGYCFWVGATKYGERAGIQVGEEKDEVVWTASSNVEAVAR